MHRGSAVALTIAGCLFVALVDYAALSLRAVSAGGRAELLGVTPWQVDADWFFGQSALHVAPGGGSAIVLNDRGTRLDVTIRRDNGRITGFDIDARSGLKNRRGRLLPQELADSEGIAVLPDGDVCVSFESVTRVHCYADRTAPARVLPGASAFPEFRINGGLEALAADATGRLYAIPERYRDSDGLVPVFRFEDGQWQVAMRLQPRGRFRPVGADIVGDDLYLLERAYSVAGFTSRITRISITDGTAETLLTTGPGKFDNLEGLSLWRDDAGRLIATMISDDNDFWIQSTEVVEYLIPE